MSSNESYGWFNTSPLYRGAWLWQAESSLIVIIAVSLNGPRCVSSPLPATSCFVIRNVRADLLCILGHFSARLPHRHTRQTAGVGIEPATLLADIFTQVIISSAVMMEWRPAERWCKTTGTRPMTECVCTRKRVGRAQPWTAPSSPHWRTAIKTFSWEQWESSREKCQLLYWAHSF